MHTSLLSGASLNFEYFTPYFYNKMKKKSGIDVKKIIFFFYNMYFYMANCMLMYLG